MLSFKEAKGLIPIFFKRLYCTLWRGHKFHRVTPYDLGGKFGVECKYCKKFEVW